MHRFYFKSFATESGKITFSFQIVKEGEVINLVHTLSHPQDLKVDLADPNVERLIYLVGLSLIPYYYGLTFADEIVVEVGNVTQGELDFFDTYFKHGLAEFMYRNKIAFNRLPKLELNSDHVIPQSRPTAQSNTYLVAHGGGKDSIVSGELLVKAKVDFSWFIMGHDGQRSQNILKSANRSAQSKTILWDQKQASQLHDPRYYRGHRPFNGYLAFLGLLVSYLHGFGYFVTSNEASASQENIVIDGVFINHQYTKSLEFEQNIRNFIHNYANTGVNYFSLLRPLSELQIAKIFTEHSKYLTTFMSCNTGIETGIWCGHCPKCAFVFLMLSSFSSVDKVSKVFGQNLLTKPELTETYLNLAGLKGSKPFECVGEIEEVQVFLAKLIQQGVPVSISHEFQKLIDEKGITYFEQLEKKYLASSYPNFIPPGLFSKIFTNYVY